SESNPLYTSVDASRPHAASADNAGKKLVEPPGFAPGSGPLITGAFIAIARANPSRINIVCATPRSKGLAQKFRRNRDGGATLAAGCGTRSTGAWRSCGWIASPRRRRRPATGRPPDAPLAHARRQPSWRADRGAGRERQGREPRPGRRGPSLNRRGRRTRRKGV